MAMDMIWRMVAIGPADHLRPALERLENQDPSPVLGCSLFEEDGPETVRFDVLFAEQPRLDEFLEALGIDEGQCEIAFGPLPEEDWVRLSLEGLKPVEAGRFVVYGAHDRESVPPGKTGIEIEAGPAFGTGHHGTTKGCLIACDRLADSQSPKRVLDLGCGTGVLAIVAALVWPRAEIVATDIDPEAIEETVVNVKKNKVEARIESFVADGFDDDRLTDPYDLIFANILAGPLQQLAAELAQRLTPGGVAVLSGLLEHQIDAVEAAYRGAGLTPAGQELIDGWAILTVKAQGSSAA